MFTVQYGGRERERGGDTASYSPRTIDSFVIGSAARVGDPTSSPAPAVLLPYPTIPYPTLTSR